MSQPAIEAADEIAERLLFPSALETDASDLPPLSHFEALAEAGLYGLTGPVEAGGKALGMRDFAAVVERLASGCLTTTFVWIQHNTPVRELTSTPNDSLRRDWLARLCSGEVRAGIALGGLQGGSAQIRAEPVEGGWLLTGAAPYVTGWGIIDLLLVAALTPDNQVVRALIDARESSSLRPERLRLLAANASATVRLHFDRHFVLGERITSLEPFKAPPAYDGGGRGNGSLALGVARRCLRLIGPSPLDSELDARRRQLDEARDEEMATARAAAAELAMRSAAALVVHHGSRSIFLQDHAQRLYREAAFLLVFGSRPAIRSSLLQRLNATPN
jgi:alkylation response protein AidB-like acyl-CoA dehydrogenase